LKIQKLSKRKKKKKKKENNMTNDNMIDVLANTHDHNELLVALNEMTKSNNLDTRLRNFILCLIDAAELSKHLDKISSIQTLSIDEDANVKVDFKVIQIDYVNEIIEILDGWLERKVYGDSTHIYATIGALIVLFYTTGQIEIGRQLYARNNNAYKLQYPLYTKVIQTYDHIERINMFANSVNEEIDEAIRKNKFAQIFTSITQSYLMTNDVTNITFMDSIDDGIHNISYIKSESFSCQLDIKFKLVPEAVFGENSCIIDLGNLFGVYSNYELSVGVSNSEIGKCIKAFDLLFDDKVCGFLNRRDQYHHLAFNDYKAFKTTSHYSEIEKYYYKSSDAVCADINEYKIRFLDNIDSIYRHLITIFTEIMKLDMEK
jgi:hypothetical protein